MKVGKRNLKYYSNAITFRNSAFLFNYEVLPFLIIYAMKILSFKMFPLLKSHEYIQSISII